MLIYELDVTFILFLFLSSDVSFKITIFIIEFVSLNIIFSVFVKFKTFHFFFEF